MFRSVRRAPQLMSHTQVCGKVWYRATRHSLEEWMGSDAMDAVLSHPTEQALTERVGGNAADLDLRLKLGCTVMCAARQRSLSRGMGRLGGGWHCLVSPRPASSREAGGR